MRQPSLSCRDLEKLGRVLRANVDEIVNQTPPPQLKQLALQAQRAVDDTRGEK